MFTRVCGPCHMAMGRVPSRVTLPAANRSEASVRRMIRGGSGAGRAMRMPAIDIDVLPEREMPALLAWLRALHVVAAP